MAKTPTCHICFSENVETMQAVKIEKLDEYVLICDACLFDVEVGISAKINKV